MSRLKQGDLESMTQPFLPILMMAHYFSGTVAMKGHKKFVLIHCRSTCIVPMDTNNKLTGVAHLCFTPDNKYFHGNFVTLQRQQYNLVGEQCDIPKENFDQCCFEDTPLFYQITVIDRGSLDLEHRTINHVMRIGGDNCSLKADCFDFHTEELLVDKKAESHIEKYFNKKLLNRDCYICIGSLTILDNKAGNS